MSDPTVHEIYYNFGLTTPLLSLLCVCMSPVDKNEQPGEQDPTIYTVAVVVIVLVLGGIIIALVVHICFKRKRARKTLTDSVDPDQKNTLKAHTPSSPSDTKRRVCTCVCNTHTFTQDISRIHT